MSILNDPPPTLEEILKGLQNVFPGGRVERGVLPDNEVYLTTEFRVGNGHRFLFKGETERSGAVYTVAWAPVSPLHRFQREHPKAIIDSCAIRTVDDLIGWTSIARMDAETAALGKIQTALFPADLFPEGNKTIRNQIQAALLTLRACGIPNIPDRLLPTAKLPWEIQTKEGVTRFRLLIKSAGDGFFVGGLQPGAMHWILEYSYSIPVSVDRDALLKGDSGLLAQGILEDRGTLDIRGTPREEQAKRSLTLLYLQALMGHVSRVLKEEV